MKAFLRFCSGIFRLPLMGAPLHRSWFWLRRRALAAAAPFIIQRYLRLHSPAKLQLGSGPGVSPLAGWLNTDLMAERWPTVRLDATRRFPFADGAFACVFSEHMIEHIPLAGGRHMLAESFRVLAPGGVSRIATPDLARILRLYGAEDETARSYLRWSAAHYRLGRDLPIAPIVINDLFHDHGHQFLYDEATLGAVLTAAGFRDIVRRRPGESGYPELHGLEVHMHVIGEEANDYETLVLEARKP
jgi:predicted SAM-dependent methyltransferase